MLQIGYVSTAAGEQDPATFDAMLAGWRRHNRRMKISGLLIAGSGRYLQILEGPHRAVEQLFYAIRADRRHDAVTTIVDRPIFDRSFDDWAMAFRHEPAIGQVDDFLETIMTMTAPLADPILRNQVRTFASLLLRRSRECTAEPWAQAS